jgi:hypothetical protein
MYMASTDELVHVICFTIGATATPVPITLMNHAVEEAAAIIGAVVERCANENIPLATISIDPELGEELGLQDGKILHHGHSPVIRWQDGLGRRVLFQRI